MLLLVASGGMVLHIRHAGTGCAGSYEPIRQRSAGCAVAPAAVLWKTWAANKTAARLAQTG